MHGSTGHSSSEITAEFVLMAQHQFGIAFPALPGANTENVSVAVRAFSQEQFQLFCLQIADHSGTASPLCCMETKALL